MHRFATLGLAVAACGGTPGTHDAPTDDAVFGPGGRRAGRVTMSSSTYRAGDPFVSTVAWARFGLEYVPDADVSLLLGLVREVGACRVVSVEMVLGCSPACDDRHDCVPAGLCVPYNNFGDDGGVVAITGANRPIELAFHAGYIDGNTPSMPAPLFDVGDTITASAPGGTWNGVTVAGFGPVTGVVPEALDVSIPDGVLALSDAAPTVLAWTPSVDPDARYLLRVGTAYSHGGSSRMVLACDGPDTGEVMIDPELAALMPRLEVPNCLGLTCVPAQLYRYVRAPVLTEDGVVELELGSQVLFYADHP